MLKFPRKRIIKLCILLFVLSIFSYEENNYITETNITIENKKIPKKLNGLKIIQISDLHNKTFGKGQRILINKINEKKPDLIVVTGDLIDMKSRSFKPGIALMKELTKKYPVYYVTGNHEWLNGNFKKLREELIKIKVNVLQNDFIDFKKNGEKIRLFGINDPESGINFDATLIALSEQREEKEFSILLSHRPERFDEYVKTNFDLVFSGHAHGGQIRIPFIGGFIAPNQGIFPKFSAGKYINKGTTMIVSRGLGNSVVPQRIFNHPEIVIVDLKQK